MTGSKNSDTLTQWNTMQQEKRKESLPFATVWMELETFMLSKISQLVKDKYHMISLIREQNDISNEQNKLMSKIEPGA